MIHKFRRLLINIGKVLPFVACLLACLNYAETSFSLATSDLIVWDGIIIPNTLISFAIGNYFEYNFQMLFVLVVISIAIETCVYNKLACGYLAINLLEKSYFVYELEPMTIYVICAVNIAVSGYLTYKGLRILIK